MKKFVLKPVLPLPAVVVAIVCFVGGALLAFLRRDNGVWLAAGIVLCIIALAMFALIISVANMMATEVIITEHGYRILGPNREHTGEWRDVTNISASRDGTRMVIRHGSVVQNYIIAPRGGEVMLALIEEVRSQLGGRTARPLDEPRISPHADEETVVVPTSRQGRGRLSPRTR